MISIYKIKYAAHMITEATSVWNGRDSDELNGFDEHKVQTRKGTTLLLSECSPNLEELNYFSDMYALLLENKFRAENLGFSISFPESFKVKAWQEKDILSSVVNETLDEKEVFFSVHHGIRGWYITEVSDSREVILELHKKFEKYAFNGIALAEPRESINGESGDAQDLYQKHIGKAPDQRYAI